MSDDTPWTEAENARQKAERDLAAARARRQETESVAGRLRDQRIENGLGNLFRIALGGKP